MRLLKEELEQAIKDENEETKRELETETKRVQREIERFQNDARRLESDYKSEKGKLESRLVQMELEAREEADRIAAECQRQVDELRSALQSSAEASEREKAEMLEQIDQLSRRGARAQAFGPAGHGVFSMIGAILDQPIPLRNGLASFLR
ncbi:hypothetical protein BJ322DRAFT_265286 [Thelephora terrestris]|uniref:Uncharacterized protein n=1 Tax=Thelephora terrestris TaxID=56493 RepID=A0A9P6H7R4_9AGAM|nr:hypothetical protein BJ322DRAFT_265286 [Thelephora terrestris]